jgi:hypothetical protein
MEGYPAAELVHDRQADRIRRRQVHPDEEAVDMYAILDQVVRAHDPHVVISAYYEVQGWKLGRQHYPQGI